MHEVTVVEVPSQLVVGVKRTGHFSDMPAVMGALFEFAASKNAQFVGAPLALYHETSKDAIEKADLEGTAVLDIAFPIGAPIDASGEFKVYEMPGGTMARVVHKGPYDQCEPAYNAVFAWVARNGKQIVGPVREVYPNDPRAVAPENILTEIYVPIA